MGSMGCDRVSWSAFEEALARVVVEYPERTFLVISCAARQTLYVQFAGVDEVRFPDEMTAQLSDLEDVDSASAEVLAEFGRLGFEKMPDRFGGMWQRDFEWPSMSQVAREVARAGVLRLRDVGGVESPAELTYRAWRDPQQFNPVGYEEPDWGEDNVLFPELGIRQIPCRK